MGSLQQHRVGSVARVRLGSQSDWSSGDSHVEQAWGWTVDPSGRRSQLSGSKAQLSGNTAQLSGDTAQLSGNTAQLLAGRNSLAS